MTWSKGFPSSGAATFMASDAQGHVIASGPFTGTIDFGGGPLVAQGVAENLFVVELDCAGNHVWSKRFGVPDMAASTRPHAMAVAPDGSVFLTGEFEGTIDFGVGVLTSQGSDGFIAKLDASGSGVWSMRVGGMTDNDTGAGIAVDAAGNAYVTGYFNGLQNFGGNVIGSSGQTNLFVLELDPNGNPVWSKVFGQPAGLPALALDLAGHVILCGSQHGAVLNFGGGALPSGTVYVAVLDAAGGFVWNKSWGTSGSYVDCNAVTTDASGDIVITGDYEAGTIDFGGGPLPNAGSPLHGAFLAKLTSTGAHVFSKGTGMNNMTSYSVGSAVAVDGSGNVYVTGGFTQTIDLGGGPVTAAGNPGHTDVFVARLGPSGSLTWLQQFGDAQNQSGFGLALDGSGAPVVGGNYLGTIDFGNGALPMGTGNGSPFIARLSP